MSVFFFGWKFLGSLVVVRFEWFQQNQTNEEKKPKKKFIEKADEKKNGQQTDELFREYTKLYGIIS